MQVQSYLSDLDSWLQTAFAVNLTYPILVQFGRFAGSMVGKWSDREKLRIIPPLAETKIHEPGFRGDINDFEARFVRYILVLNVIIIPWAVAASVFIFVLLLRSAIDPYAMVSGVELSGDILFSSMAVPLGLLVNLLIHWRARSVIHQRTKQYDALLAFTETRTTAKIKEATEALRQQLRQDRYNTD